MWCNLAASRLTGDERQSGVELRDDLEKEMTREQIAEAQRLAREFKPKRSGSQSLLDWFLLRLGQNSLRAGVIPDLLLGGFLMYAAA